MKPKVITIEEFDKKFVDFFECEREDRLPRMNAEPYTIEKFIKFLEIKENTIICQSVESIFGFMMGKHNEELCELEREYYGPMYIQTDLLAW